MQRRIIYLSMETKIREYHAKLLFTLYALERGYQVVFGSKYPMNRCIPAAPSGIFVGTGVTKALGGDLLRAKEDGHRAVSFDEEGLAYINREVFMNTRINEDIIREIDYFFTWGRHHNELVRRKAPGLTNFSPVGNMRFELLKQKYHGLYDGAVREIRERYGDFILVNSNLKVYNHLYTHRGGQEQLYKSLRGSKMIQSDEDEAFYRDRYEHQKETFESYRSLLGFLAPKIKPMCIVARPHSSESRETWQALGIPNVYVDNAGGVVPWILASCAVIQKNCTTATETVYLGKPVITYSVRHDPRFDNDITRGVGRFCQTEDEVWDALQNLDAFEEQMERDREFLSGYVSNMGTGSKGKPDEENAAAAILDILDEIDTPLVDDSGSLFKNNRLIKHYFDKLKNNAIAVFGKKTPERELKRQKFPGLSLSELRGDMECLAGAVPVQTQSIRVTKIDDNLFHFTLGDC